jgi:peptidoglycan hydrolase-like protein with peptidoglycan-binding domain
MSNAAKVLDIARAEIGYKESPSGSNKTKYGKAYGMDGQPWCAMFVWWVFKEAGCSELFYGGKKNAYCPTIADYYIAKKQTVSKSKGEPGDIVLFDFNNNNSSDHIGIIEKRNSDGTYTCIEGNTAVGNNSNGGQVMRRTRYTSQISWICRPKYTEKVAVKPATSTTTNKLAVDGKWGKTTTYKTQKVLGTTQDGIVSGQLISCKQYLQGCTTDSWKFVKYSKSGSAMVKAIQKLVGTSVDGKAGKGTVKAMQQFLKKKGYDCGATDGYMGPKTIKAWQKYINSRL